MLKPLNGVALALALADQADGLTMRRLGAVEQSVRDRRRHHRGSASVNNTAQQNRQPAKDVACQHDLAIFQ
jgi:hypothetical protein